MTAPSLVKGYLGGPEVQKWESRAKLVCCASTLKSCTIRCFCTYQCTVLLPHRTLSASVGADRTA
jgi:hypothetical protein